MFPESHIPQQYLQTLFLDAFVNDGVDTLEEILSNLAAFVQSSIMAHDHSCRQFDDPRQLYYDAEEALSEAFLVMEVSNPVQAHLNAFPYATFWDTIHRCWRQIGWDHDMGYYGSPNGGPRTHPEMWMLGCALHPDADTNAELRREIQAQHSDWIRGLTVVTTDAPVIIGSPVARNP